MPIDPKRHKLLKKSTSIFTSGDNSNEKEIELSYQWEKDSSDEESENKPEEGYIQWSVGSNDKFIPCFKTAPTVPPGIYELKINQDIGFYIQKQSHFSDDLLELPMSQVKEILIDIKKFWSREKIFKDYGYTHKRGILLYGPPGNGKSYLIQILSRHLINEMNGIVLNLKDHNAVELFIDFAGSVIRKIEPGTPIIAIMEDIDSIMEYSNSMSTKILNILDGMKSLGNRIVFIATTNYPERLQERISNRPSRFDRRYKIGTPTAAVREYYIRKKLKEADIKKIDIKRWVKETEGLSISHIKELIVSNIILDIPFEEVIQTLKNMNKKISAIGEGKSIGFGNYSYNDDIGDEGF